MDEETKKSLEDLKETVATLALTVKKDSENRTKIENIVADLEKKKLEFEEKEKASKGRKGFGASDDDDLEEGEKAKWGFNKSPNARALTKMIGTKSVDERVVELQKMNDDILIVSQILGKKPQETQIYQEVIEANPFLKKALDTATSGEGSEWIPVGYSPMLFDRIRLELMVGGMHQDINMPTAVYTPPVVSSDATGYLVSERTGDDDTLTAANRIKASNVGTTNFSLTSKKLAGRVVFSEEIDEDSIVPILPTVQQNIVIAIATAIEQATINGDTAVTHQDSDVTEATDARKAWDGYRKLAKAGAKSSLATLTAENVADMKKDMGKYGIRPKSLFWLTGISAYIQLLTLKDANNNLVLMSIDKYGAGATILNGELGQLFGSPVIVSEFIRENLNATGVYDASTTTKTEILLVNKLGFIFGTRRLLKIKVGEDITTDQQLLVATTRKAFSAVYAGASDTTVAVGYNIAA